MSADSSHSPSAKMKRSLKDLVLEDNPKTLELHLQQHHPNDKDFRSALCCAASNNKELCMRILLHSCNTDICTFGRRSALEAGIENGHRHIVQMLLRKCGCQKSQDNPYPDCASAVLGYAVCKGHVGIVNDILQAGAAWDCCNKDFVFRDAVNTLNVEMVHLLLKFGLSPKSRDNLSVYSAIKADHIEMVRLLLKAIDSKPLYYSALSTACSYNSISVVRGLIADEVDVNAAYPDQYPPLHIAVMDNFLPLVQILISAGANPNMVDMNHKTPLPYAKNLEMMKALLEAGADPNISSMGYMPLVGAILQHNFDLVEYLLDWGANPNVYLCPSANTNDYWLDLRLFSNDNRLYFRPNPHSALTAALLHGNSSCCKHLLRAGAYDIDFNMNNFIHRHYSLSNKLQLSYHLGSGILLKLLCAAGGKLLNVLNFLNHYDSTSSPAFINWVKEQDGNNRSLQQLCRIVIRNQIGWENIHKTDTLGLPKPLQDYVDLKELDTIDIVNW